MTITLDSKTLLVEGELQDDELAIISEWDAWVSGALKDKTKVWATRRRFTFPCYEMGTSWASTKVKSFKDTMAAGTAVTFTLQWGGDTIFSASVYIVGVSLRLPLGGATTLKRLEYTITLKRAD